MNNPFIQRIDNLSIKKKLWIIYFLGVMLPLLVLSGFFSQQILQEFNRRQDILISDSLKRIDQSLITTLENVENLTFAYLASSSLDDQLNLNYSFYEYESISAYKRLEDKINLDLYTFSFLDSILLYHANELLPPSSTLLPITSLEDSREMLDFIDSQNSLLFLRINDSNSQPTMGVYRKLNVFDLHSKNMMLAVIDPSTINDKLMDTTLEDFQGNVYLVDDKDQIIFSNSPFIHNKKEKIIHLPFTYNEQFNGWHLQLILPSSYLNFLPKNQVILIIFSGIGVIGIAFLFTYIVGHSISHRLSLIDQVMEKSENGPLCKIDDNLGEDEIGNTAKHYNTVVDNVHHLLNVVESERLHVSELLQEKTSAYVQLESTNKKLGAVNEELTASYEEIRLQDNKINDLIYMDQLTNLKNRYAINQAIDTSLQHNVSKDSMAILFIDVDNFKFINDVHGHAIGDKVIRETGKRLKSVESPEIVIGRFGGDEFLVLIKSNEDEFSTRIKEIHALFTKPLSVEGLQFYLTVSIGYAYYPEHGTTRDTLVKNADQALYVAKGSGRNKCTMFENTMNEQLKEKISLQGVIIESFKNNEFYLAYQPLTDVKTQKVVGYEALIRWDNPDYRHITPYQIIANAEEIGLIVELGDWIFKEACLFAKKINQHQAIPLIISVNVSGIQLEEHTLSNKFQKIINTVGIPRSFIHLEMTETYLINTIESGLKVLDQLKAAGFHIVLDDFGTGYSSLNYFKDLPITVLKIDKTFIDKITTNINDAYIVDIMIALAHKRGVTVTAEGVETKAQFHCLSEKKCDTIQGTLFSHPLSEKDAIAYLELKNNTY